jgi:hypothetical protein
MDSPAVAWESAPIDENPPNCKQPAARAEGDEGDEGDTLSPPEACAQGMLFRGFATDKVKATLARRVVKDAIPRLPCSTMRMAGE